MLTVQAEQACRIRIGDHFSVSFERTLRIPDDGRTYPLPPGIGSFPVKRIADYEDRVPAEWLDEGGFFIPMYQCEAMWLSFDGADWRPNAVQIGLGQTNTISGETWAEALEGGETNEQNYIVCPGQPWLDGINAGDGMIRQFVAMPLGEGYSVEEQVSDSEAEGGMRITCFDSKPGRFPNEPPPCSDSVGVLCCMGSTYDAETAEMGVGAGGRMKQKIYPDEYGIDVWDPQNLGQARIHIVNSAVYKQITGEDPPLSPVSAEAYTQYGYPWFDLYDENIADVAASPSLKTVKSVGELDAEAGKGDPLGDAPVLIHKSQVVKVGKIVKKSAG